MNFSIQRGLIAATLLLSALAIGPVMAAKVSKDDDVKQTCSVAGGSYSEGSNYGRCEYSNGDSYTCNTDVDKCESCTGGKCTVGMRAPGKGVGAGAGPKVLAPNTTPPSKPKAAMTPAPAKAKN